MVVGCVMETHGVQGTLILAVKTVIYVEFLALILVQWDQQDGFTDTVTVTVTIHFRVQVHRQRSEKCQLVLLTKHGVTVDAILNGHQVAACQALVHIVETGQNVVQVDQARVVRVLFE